MPKKYSHKKLKHVPGIVVECKSGRYLAFYDHRTDIVAHGDTEREAKKNLKELYKAVMTHEDEEAEKGGIRLPQDFQTKKFTDKILTR